MEPYSFHPYPIVGYIKALVIFLALTAIDFLFQDYLGQLALPVFALVLVFCISYFLRLYMVAHACTITIAENEIIYRFGILTRNEYLLPYSKITEARSTQSLFGQVLGIGTLSIDTPGYTDLPVQVRNIRMKDIRRSLDKIGLQNWPTAAQPGVQVKG